MESKVDFQLKDKIALVTGGTRGIGRAIALKLANEGVKVAICARTAADLDNTRNDFAQLGFHLLTLKVDVSEKGELENLVSDVTEKYGGLDILVNNAVTSSNARFDELTDEMFCYHIDVKLMAYVRLARLILPVMQENKWGRIINIGGMTARVVAPLRMTNGIVNAGVANFTKQFSGYAAKHNVTVNCIHPGYTKTERVIEIFERQAREANVDLNTILEERTKDIPLGKLIEPENIADLTLFFCSPMAEMLTGQSIAVDGGSGSAVLY